MFLSQELIRRPIEFCYICEFFKASASVLKAPRTIGFGDETHDGNAIGDLTESQGAVPKIPAKSNRKWKPCSSKALYGKRNQVKRFFIKL